MKGEEMKRGKKTKEKGRKSWRNVNQTFQDGTLDEGMTPIPDGPGGESSAGWLKAERDHAQVGDTH